LEPAPIVGIQGLHSREAAPQQAECSGHCSGSITGRARSVLRSMNSLLHDFRGAFCPDLIGISKLKAYAWQDEYRLMFSETDALRFETIKGQIVIGDVPQRVPNP